MPPGDRRPGSGFGPSRPVDREKGLAEPGDIERASAHALYMGIEGVPYNLALEFLISDLARFARGSKALGVSKGELQGLADKHRSYPAKNKEAVDVSPSRNHKSRDQHFC